MAATPPPTTTAVLLHQFEISPFCDKVRRALRYKGIPYRVREWPVTDPRRPAKLPVLEHAGRKIRDSTNILRYLETAFPDRPSTRSRPYPVSLVAANAVQAAQCHVLEDWADEALYFHEMRLRFMEGDNAATFLPMLLENDHWLARTWLGYTLAQRDIAGVVTTQGTGRHPAEDHLRMVRDAVGAVSALLEANGQFLVGAHLTNADLAVYAQLACIFMTPQGRAILNDFPHVQRFQNLVRALTDGAALPSKL